MRRCRMIQDGMISDAMKVRLRPGDRAILEARLRAGSTEQRQLLRIRIVLEAADGHGTREIARELETTPTTVSLWRIPVSYTHLTLPTSDLV